MALPNKSNLDISDCPPRKLGFWDAKSAELVASKKFHRQTINSTPTEENLPRALPECLFAAGFHAVFVDIADIAGKLEIAKSN
jgi:hypothetical protein